MSSTKNIVKVMNFHSLIRVDKAKKRASKYNEVEKELTRNLAALIYNRNLKLDKKMLLENPNGEVLNIYIGNDLGFCGNFNSEVSRRIKKDVDAYKMGLLAENSLLFMLMLMNCQSLFHCQIVANIVNN